MSSSYNRRIGGRVGSGEVPVLWRVPPPGRRRRALKRPPTGVVVDVSVSGLLVRAPMSDDLSTGAVIHIEVDGIAGSVTVRRMIPVRGTKLCDYGVQIASSATGLNRWVTSRIGPSVGVNDPAARRPS